MGMIETAPVLILRGANYATAEDARIALERLGATVEERAYEVETAGQPPQSSSHPRRGRPRGRSWAGGSSSSSSSSSFLSSLSL